MPNLPGTTPESLLVLAIASGDCDAVRALLDAGANTETANALLVAARSGSIELVRLLIQRGADVSLANVGSENEVKAAQRWAQETDDEGLRSMGLQLGRSALGEAAAAGNAAVIEMLLHVGAAVDQEDVLRQTPLMLASRGGHAESVRRLLQAGAKPNAMSVRKTTPLIAAVDAGSAECTRLLLAGGAKVPKRKGVAPLHTAARSGNIEIVRLLLGAGINPNATNETGQTALLCAAEQGHLDVMGTLLEAGANVNHADQYGQTPITRAPCLNISMAQWEEARDRNDPILASRIPVCALLLDRGADVNVLEGGGFTALLMAAITYNEPLTRYLLDRGANPAIGRIGKKDTLALARAQNFAPDLIARIAALTPTALPVERPTPSAAPPPTPVHRSSPRLDARPNFAPALDNPAYTAAVAELSAACRSDATPLDGIPGVFHLQVKSGADLDFDRAREIFLRRGFTIARADAADKDRVMIFPTADPIEVVAARGTDGSNFDLANADIVAWLRKLSAEHPFAIVGVGHDFVDARFLADIKTPMALARRVYRFCPDLVDQGVGGVEALAESLASGRLFLWWD